MRTFKQMNTEDLKYLYRVLACLKRNSEDAMMHTLVEVELFDRLSPEAFIVLQNEVY